MNQSLSPVKIFIAYARLDARYLEKLRRHLHPLEQKDGLPIEDWTKPNKAYHNVVKEVHQRVKRLRAKEKTAIKEEQQKEIETKRKGKEEKRKTIAETLQPTLERLRKQENPTQLHPQIQKLLQDMVFIEGGTFQMGTEDYEHTKPVHPVTISSFEMAKYPVTQAQWRAVMGSDSSELKFKGCDDCPVEQVSWEDCKAFIVSNTLVKTMHFQCKTFSCYTPLEELSLHYEDKSKRFT